MTENSTDGVRWLKQHEMLGMWLVTVGGGVGLFCFGPICDGIGRRRAFIVFHICATAVSIVLFTVLKNSTVLLTGVWLPIFGFFTLGMHAGYAVYFPELFPARIRGAAAGISFNTARVFAAPVLIYSGSLIKSGTAERFYTVTSSFSLLFLVGAVLILFGPETRGASLPD
ncbi:MAG: hypothetical protein U0936_09665 [Planctomycetaceae bacterium]